MLTHEFIESLRGRFATQEPSSSEAATIKQELRPLGELWLQPHVLEAAARHRRSLYGVTESSQPNDRSPLKSRGGCWVLLASSAAGHPLLRDAFTLPLEWRRGGQHSRRLPSGLAEEADRILGTLGIGGLSLHLQSQLEQGGRSLASLAFGYESAWAALAAGAIIFDQGGENFGDVLVSAAWQAEEGSPTVAGSRGHFAVVTGIAAKIKAAAAHGTRLLFLPKANEAEARQVVSRDEQAFKAIDLRFLESTTATPRVALRGVLGELESPPTRRDGWEFDDRARYHLRMPLEKAEEYYINELVDEVVERLKPGLPADPRLREIDRLVLVASDSRGGAYLLTKLFHPRAVLILHDGALREAEERVCALAAGIEQLARCGGRSLSVQIQECAPGARFEQEVKDVVAAWAARDTSARVFIDVTLGHRDFLFALLATVPGNAIVGYLKTKKRNQRFEAGTEQLRIVDWWPAMRGTP